VKRLYCAGVCYLTLAEDEPRDPPGSLQQPDDAADPPLPEDPPDPRCPVYFGGRRYGPRPT